MTPNKKVLFTVLSFFLAMAVIACSCSSIIPTTTTGSGGGEAIPGMAGTWKDPETSDTFVIAWQNNAYKVTSVTWEGTAYTIKSQNWDGSSLTWSYLDTDLNITVTYETVSLNGSNLDVNWSYDTGASGTETLTKQ